jgi:SAM-dependent methyltransferase
MFTLKDDGCPICGSQSKTLIGAPYKKNVTFQRFNGELDEVHIVRCSQCSGMYVSPMIYWSEELLRELYNIRYFSSESTVADHKNMSEKYNILRIAARFGPIKGKKLLDIGCGTGEYLKAASDLGMDVTGIDVDETLAAHIRSKYGYSVVVGLFEDDSFPAGTFDVIVLSHVIEHLQEPAKLLRSIRKALKPGGLFIMCTPNADSLMEDIHNLVGKLKDSSKTNYLCPFEVPYHILGFNLKSSRVILDRTGFSPIYLKLHSGLEWEDETTNSTRTLSRQLAVKGVKVAGAVLGKGMSIVTVSRAS